MGTGISGAVRAGLNSFIEKLLVVFSKVPKIRPLLNAADAAAAGAGGTGGDPGDDGDCEDPIGTGGQATSSNTLEQGDGWRLDVENANPGVRAGNMHLQFGSVGSQHHYIDPVSGQIDMSNMSAAERRTVRNNQSKIDRGIEKGKRYLNC